MTEEKRTQLMDEADVRRVVAGMAREIMERDGGTETLVLMGIHRRGTDIADWIADEIEEAEGKRPPQGSIDISLYRDDLEEIGPRPVVGGSELPPEGIEDRTVVIVDDVAYTGRTVRAALNELSDWGRPRRVLLCVLIDRGGRELPIQPDITGRIFQVLPRQRVEVLVPDIDGAIGVDLLDPEDAET
ncbi:MAG: bifunctional pyr operon transcriptional regulator/uracil phosphoribosyltransferase PyrR [Gemmatimonadota bacterium]